MSQRFIVAPNHSHFVVKKLEKTVGESWNFGIFLNFLPFKKSVDFVVAGVDSSKKNPTELKLKFWKTTTADQILFFKKRRCVTDVSYKSCFNYLDEILQK